MLIKDKADLINYIQTKSPGDNLALTIIDNSGVTKAYVQKHCVSEPNTKSTNIHFI